MERPGLNTLRKQLEDQKKQLDDLAELFRKNESSSIKTSSSGSKPASPSFATSLYQVKSEIDNSKNGQAADRLDNIYEEFQREMPEVLKTGDGFGELVIYAIDFVDEKAKEFMSLMQIVQNDKSMFKLNTCLQLILSVLPEDIQINKIILASIIEAIVHIKNEYKVIKVEQPSPITSLPKEKKKGLLGKLAKQ